MGKCQNPGIPDGQLSKPWHTRCACVKTLAHQMDMCQNNADHQLNGKIHKHTCAFCLTQGRYMAHPEKDCYFAKNREIQQMSSKLSIVEQLSSKDRQVSNGISRIPPMTPENVLKPLNRMLELIRDNYDKHIIDLTDNLKRNLLRFNKI